MVKIENPPSEISKNKKDWLSAYTINACTLNAGTTYNNQ